MNTILSFIDAPADFKPWTDWRLPENRLEAFRRVAYTRMMEGDLDHHHTAKVIVDMMNLSDDNKVLYCLLFGQSYRNHWAMIILQTFPDLLAVPQADLQAWHDANWQRSFYGKDCKWGVRKFPQFVQSIREQLNGKSPYEYYSKLVKSADIRNNFNWLNQRIRNLYGMGRMTSWLAQQTFYELFHWNIDYWDLQLHDDTWSQYDSLCYLFNREDLAYDKSKKTYDSVTQMENNCLYLMNYVNKDSPIHMDIYNIESCLCEYRKTAAPRRKPKEFTFWTSTELAMQFQKIAEAWPDIDWIPYIVGMMCKGPNVRKYLFSEEYFRVIYDHGLNLNTHHYFDDEPDAFQILSLPKPIPSSIKYLFDRWNEIPQNYQNEFIEKYDPTLMVRL